MITAIGLILWAAGRAIHFFVRPTNMLDQLRWTVHGPTKMETRFVITGNLLQWLGILFLLIAAALSAWRYFP